MSDYERIYLQPECCADPDVGRLWCQDDGPESCPDGEKWTPYVLASECARLQSELEKSEARIAELEDFCADKIGRLPLPDDRTIFADGRYTAFREVYDEAQRLRQQADELEKGESDA